MTGLTLAYTSCFLPWVSLSYMQETPNFFFRNLEIKKS